MKTKVKIKKTPSKAAKELDKVALNMRGPNRVLVGLPKGSNDYPDGTSVIMVGIVHEFGSPAISVPQRSFLRLTVVEKRKKYKTLFRNLAREMVAGKINTKQALGTVGLAVQSDVRQKITDISSPPLKHRDGNPLVDNGHLRGSITFEVRDKRL